MLWSLVHSSSSTSEKQKRKMENNLGFSSHYSISGDIQWFPATFCEDFFIKDAKIIFYNSSRSNKNGESLESDILDFKTANFYAFWCCVHFYHKIGIQVHKMNYYMKWEKKTTNRRKFTWSTEEDDKNKKILSKTKAGKKTGKGLIYQLVHHDQPHAIISSTVLGEIKCQLKEISAIIIYIMSINYWYSSYNLYISHTSCICRVKVQQYSTS